MTHIAFITLFLGLVTGQQNIQMKVTGPAAKIEFQVDGRVAGVITQPWTAVINFGSRLRPHRVVARALDESGREVARTEQLVNLPEALSALQLVLERDGGTVKGVQVLWHSLEADEPKSASVALDGKPLPLDDYLHAAIPTVDMGIPHVLRGNATAPSGLPSSAELAFGGGLEDQAGARLTPIAVRLLRMNMSPKPADFEHWLRIGDALAKVVAVEQLPARIVVVRHPVRTETAIWLDPVGFSIHSSRVVPAAAHADDPTAMFVWPAANRSASSSHADLFDWSKPVAFGSADGLRLLLARAVGPPFTQLQFAQAVAVAGLRAMDGRRPRAVVLVIDESYADSSDLDPAAVRDYLQSIGVPLYVWSIVPGGEGWGGVTDISSPVAFRKAFEQLQADLRSQRIVWIDGDHLPADVRAITDDIETLAKP